MSDENTILQSFTNYIHDKVVNPELENLRTRNNDLEGELQQMKSYILSLEQRLLDLEKVSTTNVTEINNLQNSVNSISKKKKHFWEKN